MSAERVLAALRRKGAVLAKERDSARYAVFPGGDRRRRPLAKARPDEVAALLSEGAISSSGQDEYRLSEAGGARLRREAAGDNHAFLAQHAAFEPAKVATAKRLMSGGVLGRLAALRDSNGAPWLADHEVRAAQTLRADWERAQRGLLHGSDWSAPPMGSSARGPANAQEKALAARCDARASYQAAIDTLAPPLRRVVEGVCLREEGLEGVERDESWPARSAKLALKLGLAQLALCYASLSR